MWAASNVSVICRWHQSDQASQFTDVLKLTVTFATHSMILQNKDKNAMELFTAITIAFETESELEDRI